MKEFVVFRSYAEYIYAVKKEDFERWHDGKTLELRKFAKGRTGNFEIIDEEVIMFGHFDKKRLDRLLFQTAEEIRKMEPLK